MDALDHLILFADLVGSTDVACELPIEAYARTYIGSFHWAADKAFRLLAEAGPAYEEVGQKFKREIAREEWAIVGDELTSITHLNGRSEEELKSLVVCACAFAYNLKLYWLLSPYNLCRLQNRQFPRDLAVGIHIGPLAPVSKSITTAAGLHLSVAKRIETEARTGIESRIFASPDIIHFFNAWAAAAKSSRFQEIPPICSTVFHRREKAVEAKGIPKPLRVSELEWNENVLNDISFWERMMDSDQDLPGNVWDNTADAIAKTVYEPREGEFRFDHDKERTLPNYASELIDLLIEEPAKYVRQWFAAIESQPKIFADEAWLVLNTLFITVALYRYVKTESGMKAVGVTKQETAAYRETAKRVLNNWTALRQAAKDRQPDCPYIKEP